MLSVALTTETSATPEQVRALAGTDFSPHRAKIWPNVTEKRLDVHDRGDTYAEVTEGATGLARFAWVRSRYDWSQLGTVKQTVLDSNVLEARSTWELMVVAREGGGSTVSMTVQRRFRQSAAGRVASALNHLAGKGGWRWFLRSALNAVEKASPGEIDPRSDARRHQPQPDDAAEKPAAGGSRKGT